MSRIAVRLQGGGRVWIVGWALLATLAAVVPVGRAWSAECGDATAWQSAELARVDGDEFTMRSGLVLRLARLRFAPSDEAARRDGWLSSLAGSPVLVRALGEADRWGVTAGEMLLAPDRLDIGELLVGEGLAVLDPGAGPAPCNPDLPAREAAARARRLGWWRGPDAVLDAREPAAIGARAGRFTLVEGPVVSVGERRERTYLNFGRDFARDFAVVIAKRDWTAMAARGLTAASLRGRFVRVRGLVEVRRGPSMAVDTADAIELLPPASRAP